MEIAAYFEDFTKRDWQSDPEGTLDVAVVGLGNWALNHALPAISEAAHCELTTVVTSNEHAGQEVAREYGIDHVLNYEEYSDGVANSVYDSVYVVTPNGTHLEYVQTAARNQKAVLCEKPLEATTSRAEELVGVCDRHDVPLMVAYRMQVDPAVRRARELIRDGLIGDPVHVYGNNSVQLLEDFPDADQWRLNPDLVGYGVSVSDIGIYPVNTTRFLLERDPRFVQASAVSPTDVFQDVPDERCSFLVEFEDGIQSAFTSSQNAYSESHLTVVGTKGTVELSPAFHLETELTIQRGGTETSTSFEWINEMVEEFEYFADHVLSGRSIGPDGRHGLVDMYTLEAIYDSIEQGRRVEI
ncbi:D-xylose 1-dehydrogenase Gfo6 [Halorubrum vacuolatum]|uniref:D-xylose dehydrogenase (NADP) n=1 Tax=Halorubrum vacuolatum TaxID=63740 RepID=A0A238XQK2_HALVU|nr:D-xylose 1-dehydrogenase Gfo6 [Halorubrum vacuolatum]SNR60858.1 D-xylose dehydrogenase (NADP) [Halorubrum vacuolatum]